MKPYLILLFVVVFFTSCENQEKKEDVQAYLNATFRLYQERNEDTAAIAEILNEGLAKYPDSIPLLQSRGNLYCSRGMLSECRADTLRLLKIKPDLAEARMMLCMLDEFEGVGQKVDEACYLEAASLFAARSPSSSPDLQTANKLNYIFALLMANHPDAEEEKNAFLAREAANPQSWLYHGILDDFNRERALSGIFGK